MFTLKNTGDFFLQNRMFNNILAATDCDFVPPFGMVKSRDPSYTA